MAEHVMSLVTNSGQNLYALKTLKAHGLDNKSITDVCRATLVAKLSYAAPAWYGFTSCSERAWLQVVISKAKRLRVYDSHAPDLEEVINNADKVLFKKILDNTSHVLHQLLPAIKTHSHNLRTRAHNRMLPTNTTSLARNFLNRMLYKNIF